MNTLCRETLACETIDDIMEDDVTSGTEECSKENDMLYTFVGNGSGDTIYDSRLVSIDDRVSPEEVQIHMDEWVRTLSDELLDRFDDLDHEKVSIEDIVEAMPNEWNATLTEEKGGCIFV